MKQFPIMKLDHKGKDYIPYDVIEPHEKQALKNHGQTLERLAERGGLSWSEAYAVLNDSSFPHRKDYISEEYYKEKVREIVEKYKYLSDTIEIDKEGDTMTESEKHLWLDGEDGLKPYLRMKESGMPEGKVEQIAWLLLNGSGCGFCKVCRDKPCGIKDGEKCTKNIADYIRKIVLDEYNEVNNMKEWNLIDNDITNKLPKEDCEIWITRTCFDGSRWVQKVDFYADNEEIIEWDGTLAWMVASDEDEKPEPYQGEYCQLIQDVR